MFFLGVIRFVLFCCMVITWYTVVCIGWINGAVLVEPLYLLEIMINLYSLLSPSDFISLDKERFRVLGVQSITLPCKSMPIAVFMNHSFIGAFQCIVGLVVDLWMTV